MAQSVHPFRPVTDSERCEGCRLKEQENAELRARVARLERAVQRDSSFYERRAVNDGKAQVKLRQ